MDIRQKVLRLEALLPYSCTKLLLNPVCFMAGDILFLLPVARAMCLVRAQMMMSQSPQFNSIQYSVHNEKPFALQRLLTVCTNPRHRVSIILCRSNDAMYA